MQVSGKVVPQGGPGTILSSNGVGQKASPIIRTILPNLKRKVGLSQFSKNRGLGDADQDMTSR